jgi:hypothetical protein
MNHPEKEKDGGLNREAPWVMLTPLERIIEAPTLRGIFQPIPVMNRLGFLTG